MVKVAIKWETDGEIQKNIVSWRYEKAKNRKNYEKMDIEPGAPDAGIYGFGPE
ncbi:MAG: hypothetical protein V8Q38_00240 [Alistipes putredinis]|uniref:hypothetical protein n=1 Tax=Alistipes putredinis TaxID=28117 RepID=UPI0030315C4C